MLTKSLYVNSEPLHNGTTSTVVTLALLPVHILQKVQAILTQWLEE